MHKSVFSSRFKNTKLLVITHPNMSLDEPACSIALDGEILNDRWLSISCIGRGTFATIWLGRDLDAAVSKSSKHKSHKNHNKRAQEKAKNKSPDMSRYYAIKVFSSDEEDTYRHELKLMRLFEKENCPGSMTIIENFTHKLDGEVHGVIVMPLCRGSVLSSIPETGCDINIARQILRQVFEAISAIHDTGFAHGDLKPENILVEGINPKVLKLISSIEKRMNDRKMPFDNYTGKPHKFSELSKRFTREILENISENKLKVEDAKFDVDEDVTIRVSDFGTCAVSTSGIPDEKTVYYSGVEGLLDIAIPDNRKTDVWALACTAWEIVTGSILFDWRDIDEDEDLQPQSTLQLIMRTLGARDPALLELMRQSTLYDTPPRGSIITSMACNPILTAEGYLKGVTRLKPRPLTNMFATSMQRSIDGNEDIGYFIDLMYTMLEYDPSKRPDIKQLLKHPFFIEPEIASNSD